MAPTSDSNARTSKSAGCARDTCTDPPFPVSDFIRDYVAYLDSWPITAMQMDGGSRYVLHVHFRRNLGTAVGAWKKKWWHLSGRGAVICRSV